MGEGVGRQVALLLSWGHYSEGLTVSGGMLSQAGSGRVW